MASLRFSWPKRPRLAPQVALYAFARSRRNPVRRSLNPLQSWLMVLDEWVAWRFAQRGDPLEQLLPLIKAEWDRLRPMPDDQFDAVVAQEAVAASDLGQAPLMARAFAQGLEAVRRQTGLSMRQTQIACALGLLRGDCIEMRTGEGKTLAAGLAALVAARAGISTHVITVNDYLAERDHGIIAPVAARLGVSSGVLRQSMSDAEKRKVYDVDLLYGTNKTFVFDHLRDVRDLRKDARSVPRQMGQAFAIVDEADSVLIDDATVPMLLSEPAGALPEIDSRLFHDLAGFAGDLPANTHRRRDGNGMWRLTTEAILELHSVSQGWTHPVCGTEDLLHLAEEALNASYNFRRGEAYLVQDGTVVMIDQSTGRLMPDRRWGYGTHQFVEIKEGLKPSAENRTVAQITQQTYFRQYRLLSGLTGTARECRGELWAVYALPVHKIAPFAPPKLQDLGLTVHQTAVEKNRFIADRAIQMARQRAVLVGVNDVIEAEALANLCRRLGQQVAVLDAQSEAQEAELVADAGQIGRVTIATHLAGRGTDIALQGQLRAAGGLHVIIGSAMSSGRLERQLYGRAGRQGDPGSFEIAVSMQDRGLKDGAMSVWRRMMTRALGLRLGARFALAQIQSLRDANASRARKRALINEQNLARQLGYR